jgi:plastocyanin
MLVPVGLLLAACGGYSSKPKTASASASGAPRQTISVSEKEYSLTPASFHVAEPGTYAFKATNDGTVAHALEIEGNGVEARTGSIDPGSSGTLTVKLQKTGSYEIYCPIDEHEAMGMKGELTVGGSPGKSGKTTSHETTTSGSNRGY